MPNQRPFFLSSFLAAFRQQASSLQATQQAAKHSTQAASSSASSPSQTASSASRAISAAASPAAQSGTSRSAAASASGIPIPNTSARRRGSDSSTEGFRDVISADKWYIGGRTAGGEDRFFKLGVVHRVRSNDGLSLDRLSL